mmetsp:Transcript_69771/g.213942  ORF Transcript_69771/g.213942 Transcript_69771/m.213942 type:complete len:297 (+) Transcript_69771:265-1155(+)
MALSFSEWSYCRPTLSLSTPEHSDSWGKTKTPCCTPLLHSCVTDSASPRPPGEARADFAPGSHLSFVESLAVNKKRAALCTASSLAPLVKETDTTRPWPISSYQFTRSSKSTLALLHRWTTTAMFAGRMGAKSPPGSAGPPAAGSCPGCLSRSSGTKSGTTSATRFLNSSLMFGGTSSSVRPLSANAFNHISLFINIRITSLPRSCRKGRAWQNLTINFQAPSLSSTVSRASTSLRKCTHVIRNSENCCSQPFSHFMGVSLVSLTALPSDVLSRASRSSTGGSHIGAPGPAAGKRA